MLVVRKEQIETLSGVAATGFANELVEHVKKFSPRHAQAVGDDAIRKSVDLGLERSRSYGFTKRGTVRFFVELMVMFGRDFDTDPMLPWANGVLTNESIKLEMERADILHDEMMAYLDQTAGRDNEYLFSALRKLERARLEDFQSQGGSFDGAVRSGLKNIYPQKYDYVGEDIINGLIDRGKGAAAARSVTSPHGAALFIVLLFELGHGIFDDPLYPWVSQTLDDESIGNPDERVQRLQARLKAYLDQTLKNLGQETTNG